MLASLLMETVTVVLAPAASVPLVEERLTQVCTFEAVQFIELPPVFCSVYPWLEGLKDPPWVPEEVRPSGGVTVRVASRRFRY